MGLGKDFLLGGRVRATRGWIRYQGGYQGFHVGRPYSW